MIDPLTMLLNNTINIFLINPNIILYHFLFIKCLRTSKISLVSIELKPTQKNFTIPFNLNFFHVINCKSFDILPKHSA